MTEIFPSQPVRDVQPPKDPPHQTGSTDQVEIPESTFYQRPRPRQARLRPNWLGVGVSANTNQDIAGALSMFFCIPAQDREVPTPGEAGELPPLPPAGTSSMIRDFGECVWVECEKIIKGAEYRGANHPGQLV